MVQGIAMFKPLKLKAEDKEDLLILSAYLQDAVTVIEDIAYQPQARRFVIMLNRYIWENTCEKTGQPIRKDEEACARIRTALHFEDVLRVSTQNMPQKLKSHILELLAIEATAGDQGNCFIDLIFAGDEVIRLEAELINARMQDIGDPWPAKCHPKHKILEELRD
tara:strand:- start:34582 stop:35076 length:495 start_codon:yes stop_codon:yes gene_type:complete